MGMLGSLTSFMRDIVRGPDPWALEPKTALEEHNNVDVVRRMLAAANEGDVVRMMSFYRTDFRCEENGQRRPASGAQADIAPSREFLWAFPDRELTVEQVIARDDHVVVRWTITGTHEREWEGIAASGAEVVVAGCSIYRLRAGKLERAWHYQDNLSLLEQLDRRGDEATEAS